MSNGGGAQDHMPNGGGAGHPRGADVATIAGQYSCTSLISRAFPHLWPRGAEISFCLTIDHCRTILYYTVLLLDLALRRRYCRLFTLLFRPGSLTGLQTLTDTKPLWMAPRPNKVLVASRPSISKSWLQRVVISLDDDVKICDMGGDHSYRATLGGRLVVRRSQ